jgi:hypothetical protein
MKRQQQKPQIIRLSEKFDKQLLAILSEELNLLKTTKDHIIKTLTPDPNGLLVA